MHCETRPRSHNLCDLAETVKARSTTFVTLQGIDGLPYAKVPP